jgi:hypothetical protein
MNSARPLVTAQDIVKPLKVGAFAKIYLPQRSMPVVLSLPRAVQFVPGSPASRKYAFLNPVEANGRTISARSLDHLRRPRIEIDAPVSGGSMRGDLVPTGGGGAGSERATLHTSTSSRPNRPPLAVSKHSSTQGLVPATNWQQAPTIGVTAKLGNVKPTASGSAVSRDRAHSRPEMPSQGAPAGLPLARSRSAEDDIDSTPARFGRLLSSVMAPVGVVDQQRRVNSGDALVPTMPAVNGARPDEGTLVTGDLYLDGTALGRWITTHLERELTRPNPGTTALDGRTIAPWPGSPITY